MGVPFCKISKPTGLYLALLAMLGLSAPTPVALSLEQVATGLANPVFVTAAPGDNDRLFVVELSGRIKIIKNGSLLPVPFLNIDAIVQSGGERGLLGMAFHPEYSGNGFFFVNYTGNHGNTRVSRFSVSGDPDVANPASELNILTQVQPFSNHNAGMLAFGPDGYLYVGFGDGGSANDPQNNGQKATTWLAKMLRIDVNNGSPYSIPADNPYVGAVDTLEEIWAFGLRNPWRYSFDRLTGDLYIGDVGQNAIEEIDFQLSTSTGGENYGWRLKEGTLCFNPPSGCDPAGLLVDPVYEYSHGGNPFRCSVTGGYVYRGCAIPELDGAYFFGDFCSGNIWSFRTDGSSVTDFTDHTADLGSSLFGISSFGQDARGEIYVINYHTGTIYKIVPDGESLCDCCAVTGDINHSGGAIPVDVTDVLALVAYLFLGGARPQCMSESDVTGGCEGIGPDVIDVLAIVAYLFQGADDLPPCHDCGW